MRYISKNNTITKNDISTIEIFFDNGNFVTVHDFEIDSLEISAYGRLFMHDDEICRVAYKGDIVLSIDVYDNMTVSSFTHGMPHAWLMRIITILLSKFVKKLQKKQIRY